MNKINLIFRAILLFVFKILPVNKNYAYFMSFHGMYSDNSKYMSKYIYSQNKKMRLIWEISEKSQGYKDKNIFIVKTGSIKALYYYSRSKYLFDNYSGFLSLYVTKNSFVSKILIFLYKKKKQINISFWHGVPFKKINSDNPLESKKVNKIFLTTSNKIFVGCNHLRDVLANDQNSKVSINIVGSPRIDELINFKKNNEYKISLKQKLSIPLDSNIILYAPTYRSNKMDSGITQLKSMDIKKIIYTLQNKFNQKYVFVLRLHDSVLLDLEKELPSSTNIILGNKSDDMTDYLMICDALITDYSGSIYEAFCASIPCFLYCHDYEKYSSNRGLYFSKKEMPINYNETFDELINEMINFNYEEYLAKVNLFLKKIGSLEDGKACERIYKDVFN